MTDVADLVMRSDSSDIRESSKDLDKLAATGERTEKRWKKSSKGMEKSSKSLNQRLDKTGKMLLGLGAGFSAGAVISQMNQMRKEAASFSESIAEVSTLLGDSANMQHYNKMSKELAKTYGTMPIDQAKSFYSVISAGASTAAEATKTLTAANKLAVGGVTNIETAVDGLTSTLNAYRMESSQATSVSDAFFVAMRAGKTTVGELANSIGNVAGIASSAGISLEELLASVSAMTTSGIQTSVAMNSIRQTIVSILKPTTQAQEEIARLNKEFDGAPLKFDAATLKAEGFQAMMSKIQKVTGGSADSLTKLFGSVEALNTVMNLTGPLADKFNNIMEDMGVRAGETEKAYDKMADKIQQQNKMLSANFQELRVSAGEGINKALLPAITKLNENFDEVVGVVKALVQWIGILLATKLIWWVGAAAGKFIMLRVEAFAAAASMQTFATSTGGATLALSRLHKAMLVITAGFAGWQIGKWARNKFEIVEKAGIGLARGMHRTLVSMKGEFDLFAKEASRALTSPIDTARDKIVGFLRWVSGLGGNVAGLLGFDNIEETLDNAMSGWYSETAAEHKKALQTIAKNTKKELKQIDKFYGEMYENVGKGQEEINDINLEGLKIYTQIRDTSIEAFGKTGQQALGDYANELQDIIDGLRPIEAETRKIKNQINVLRNAVGKDGGITQNQFIQMSSELIKVDTDVRRVNDSIFKLGDEAYSLENIFENTTREIQSSLSDMFYNILNDGKITFDNLLDYFKRMASEMMSQEIMLRISGQGGGPITDLLGGLFGGGGSGGSGGGGMGDMLSNFGNFSKLLNTVNGGLATMGQNVIQFGAEGLASMGFRNTAASWTQTGTAAMNSVSGLPGGMAGGSLITAGAGWAGGQAGNALGESIIGKEAESNYGQAAGGVAGGVIGASSAAMGATYGSWAGPIGAAIGAAIGAIIDVALGGDGKKRSALGVRAKPGVPEGADYTGKKVIAESGLELTAFSKRAGDRAMEAANQMVDQFAAADSMMIDFADRMFDVQGINLSKIPLPGKSSEAGVEGEHGFFGAAAMNGEFGDQLKNAGKNFVRQWVEVVNERMGTDINFDPILAMKDDAESVAGTFNRVNGQFQGMNKVLELLGEEAMDFSNDSLKTANMLAKGIAEINDLGLAESFTSGEFGKQINKWLTMLDKVNTVENLTGRDPVNAWESNQTTDWQTWNKQNQSVSDFAEVAETEQEFDLLIGMVKERYQLEQQMIGQIMGYLEQSAQGFAQTFEQVFVDGLKSEQEKYEYFRKQADQLAKQIRGMTDPEKIAAAGEKWRNLFGKAYGALSEGSRDKMRDDLLSTIESVEAMVQKKLEGSLDAISAESDADTPGSVASVVQGATSEIREEIKASMQDLIDEQRQAAADQAAAAAQNRQAAEDFMSGVGQFGIYTNNMPTTITVNIDGQDQEVNA